MKDEKFTLKGFTGGLNDRDEPADLKPSELAISENWITDEGGFGRKRFGKDLLQYAPIDPQQATADADTVGLWHLEETADPYIDSGPNGLNLGSLGHVTAEAGVFGLAQRFWSAGDTSPAPDGSVLSQQFAKALIDGKDKIMFRAWFKIDQEFSGRPQTIIRAGTSYTVNDDGAYIVGIARAAGGRPGVSMFGVTAHRDWDTEAGKDASDPYLKFNLFTDGVPGTETIVRSRNLPTGRWLHVKAYYDQADGYMKLDINGENHATATPNGGGPVSVPTTDANVRVAIGGAFQVAYTPFSFIWKSFNGIIEDVDICTTVRAGFPFKKPHGRPMPFSKSDGTKQLVVSAEGGLYYTVGDLGWTPIATGFSEVDDWDAKQSGDILYLSNGVDDPKTWDGDTLRDWGERKTPLTLTPDASGTGLAAGRYRYFSTMLFGDAETGPSIVAEITLDVPSNVAITDIPTGPSTCTGRRIYRTKVNPTDDSAIYLLRELAENVTTELSGVYTAGSGPSTASGSDGLADATLGTGEYTEMTALVRTTAMGKPRYLLPIFNRMFMAGFDDRPYTAEFTELLAFEVRPVAFFVNAESDVGPIVGMANYYGELHASKDGKATLVLRGDNPDNWREFENLHPTIGAIDHWSYVHRTIPGAQGSSDTYSLCFYGGNGRFYEYLGNEFRDISDIITGTLEGLSQSTAARLQFSTTTQAQWQAAKNNGGSATENIETTKYEQDGLRQVAGRMGLVNQLDYMGLWTRAGALVSGNVISVEKMDGEGEFLFATDAANQLYYTPDNFKTVTTIPATPLAAGERIIQIVRRATDDFWFLLTDTANANPLILSSAGGRIYSVEDPKGLTIGPVWKTGTDTLYYDLDVPNRMQGNFTDPNRKLGNTAIGALGGSALNIFVNHAQSVVMSTNFYKLFNPTILATWHRELSKNGESITAGFVSAVFTAGTSIASDTNYVDTIAVTPGFYSAYTRRDNAIASNTTMLRVDYTRREFPRWRGGTFSPQAFWDATNGRLVMLASTAEDANGNRLTHIRTVTSALALGTYAIAGKSVSAITPTGAQLLMWTVNRAADDGNPASYGFRGRIEKSTLAAPGTITATAADIFGSIGLRLFFNSQNALTYAASFKTFALGLAQEDFWTYTGSIKTVPVATSVPADLLTLTVDGNTGPLAIEFANQTVTPYKTYVAIKNITDVTLYGIAKEMTAATSVKDDPYEGPDAGAPTNTIVSNLLFVPASGDAGGNRWADRLYWYAGAADDNDARMVQLGVPGTWTVLGTFEGEAHNFGPFTAFDNFVTDFTAGGNQNIVNFYLRNGADPADLAAAEYVPQTPNRKIGGFAPPKAYGQWEVAFTWNYSVANPTAYPSVAFINIGYFEGETQVPRVIGFQWEGRTYWAVAEKGQAENNVVLVYQKNNTWTKYRGWNLKGTAEFRGGLVALEFYQLVQLESGTKDLGNLIKSRARTGSLTSENQDQSVRRVYANVMSFQNEDAPEKDGYMELVTLAAGREMGNIWNIPIPAETETNQRQVDGVPTAGANFGWARVMQLELRTSTAEAGNYVPVVGQPEKVAGVIVEMRQSKPRRRSAYR